MKHNKSGTEQCTLWAHQRLETSRTQSLLTCFSHIGTWWRIPSPICASQTVFELCEKKVHVVATFLIAPCSIFMDVVALPLAATWPQHFLIFFQRSSEVWQDSRKSVHGQRPHNQPWKKLLLNPSSRRTGSGFDVNVRNHGETPKDPSRLLPFFQLRGKTFAKIFE